MSRREATRTLSSPLWANVWIKKDVEDGDIQGYRKRETYRRRWAAPLDRPRDPSAPYLAKKKSYERSASSTKNPQLTAITLPKVHKRPIEPHLSLALIHRRIPRIEAPRRRTGQDPRVGRDGFDALVVAQAGG